MARKKIEPITSLGNDDKLTVQKSLPLFALWRSELTLAEKLPARSDEEGKIVSNLFLEQLLQYLSEDERYLIRLRYFDNKTQSETAKYMGITQVQVSRREKKILHKLWEKGNL